MHTDQPNLTAQQQALAEEVRELYGNALTANLTVILVAVLFSAAFSDLVAEASLRLWQGLIIFFSVLRLLTLYRFQYHRSSASSEQWARRYMWLTLVCRVDVGEHVRLRLFI